MDEDQKMLKEDQKREYCKDEVELIDILRVIWKWKYLILSGTIVCVLLAVIISFTMPKIYRVDMALQIGILDMNRNGNKVYIDSIDNIKMIIQTGILKKGILKYIEKDQRKNFSNLLKFKVSAPNNSEIIKISYESASVEFGVNLMKALYQALLEKYDELVKYYKDNYDQEIQDVKAQFDILDAESVVYEQRVKRAQKRINDLRTLLKNMDSKHNLLIQKQDDLVQKKENGEKNLSILLYNNMLQQTRLLHNQYKDDIENQLYIVENEKVEKKKRYYRQQILYENIKNLELKKDTIHNFKILRSPTSTAYPIKPKIKQNVILALISGIFIMVFLSFFMEYISTQMKKKDDTNL